jgi:hypothetical protein
MFRFISALVGVAALAAASALPAAAAPITGNLSMYGDFKPLKSDGTVTGDLRQAAKIDFKPYGAGGSFQTGDADGDLASFADMSGGTIKDFTFSPFSPQSTFYVITSGGETLSFDLTGLSIDVQTIRYLDMSGTGTLHLTGFDDTPGTWNFTGQSSRSDGSLAATFSWSAGSSAEEVPEPATLLLTSVGLFAVGFVRRRRT